MKPWEIQRKRAEKRRREEARRERKNAPRTAAQNFRIVRVEGGGELVETLVESVIVKNVDESVYEASYEEVEAGMTLVVEDSRGLIARAVVEEKVDADEEGSLRTLKIRVA